MSRGHKGQTREEIVADIADRDREVLAFIRQHIDIHHYPPSIRDIADYLGVGSIQTAHRAVQRLVDQGLIRMTPGIARSISISHTDMVQGNMEEM